VDAAISALDQLIAKKRDIKQGAMQELLTGKLRLPDFRQRSAFKQTEVGLIPKDWDTKSADEICIKIQDGTHFSPKLGRVCKVVKWQDETL
jgi:type I restriction enzyme S subunit